MSVSEPIKQRLASIDPPWWLVCTNSTWIHARANLAEECLISIHSVDGRKAQTTQSMFSEFAKSLEFPSYFGENWAAFDECLADLNWLDFSRIAIVVRHAELLLAREQSDQLEAFLEIVSHAGEEWSNPVQDGEWWDHGKVPFHVVLAVSDPESVLGLIDRIEATGFGVPPESMFVQS